MPPKGPDASAVHQFKVTLQNTRPLVWRRIQVRASTILPRLHDTIQVAMGWTDSHPRQVIINGVEYGLPDPDFADDMRSEQRIKLERVVTTEKDRFVYAYDFGDSWTHRDRLARFGAEYIEAALTASGRSVVVVDPSEMHDDLVRDMIDVMTSFCARLYGRRSARNRATKGVAAAMEDHPC